LLCVAVLHSSHQFDCEVLLSINFAVAHNALLLVNLTHDGVLLQKNPDAKECVDAIAAVEAWEEKEAAVAQEHFKKHSSNAQHKSRSLMEKNGRSTGMRAYTNPMAPWERKSALTGIGALPGF
jgi:hypothetical protein